MTSNTCRTNCPNRTIHPTKRTQACRCSAPTYRIRLQLDNVNKLVENGVRFVCDDRRSWDASWFTARPAEAKTWKTERGAQRWLAERPAIKGTVETVP